MCPGFASWSSLSHRGRREGRVFFAPAASYAVKKAYEFVTTGTPNNPAFPAQWCDGLLRALPGVPGFVSHRREWVIHSLDPSVGGTGPHDFAVRTGAFVACANASIA